jgi:hypothetical protein
MYIVHRINPNKTFYTTVEVMQKNDTFIIDAERVLTMFLDGGDNEYTDIIDRLKLPKGCFCVVKRVIDKEYAKRFAKVEKIRESVREEVKEELIFKL